MATKSKGRPENKIWLHWTNLPGESSGTSKVKCNFCGNVQRKHSIKCTLHTSTCNKASQEIKRQFRKTSGNSRMSELEDEVIQLSDDNEAEVVDVVTPVNEPAKDSDFSETPHKQKQTKLDRHVVVISKQKQKELEIEFVKALISGNIPFRWTQNYYLENFFEKLGTGFKIPSERSVAGGLLDTLEKQINSESRKQLSEMSNISIELDGWENINGFGVVNILLSTTEKRIFYKSFETGAVSQTHDVILQYLDDTARDIGIEKIAAVVTDQGANYLKARNMFSEINPSVMSINCASHVLNNLAKDLSKLPGLNSLLRKAKTVVVEIKGSKLKLASFKKEFGKYSEEQKARGKNAKPVTLSLPAETRWFGIKDMIYKLRRSKTVLLRLAVNPESTLTYAVKNILKDDAFWTKLDEAFNLLAPIINAIAFVEKDSSNLSDVAEILMILKRYYVDESENSIKFKCPTLLSNMDWNKLKSVALRRLSASNFSHVYFIANMLNPKYRGNRFKNDEDQLIMVLHALDSYSSNLGIAGTEQEKNMLATQLTTYRQKTGIFGVSMLACHEPVPYWKNMESFQQATMLSKIALRLLSIPATSAGVERSFSEQAALQPKYRNRLQSTKAEKMMRVKWGLKQERNAKSNHSLKEVRNVDSLCDFLFADPLFDFDIDHENNDDEEDTDDLNTILIIEEPYSDNDLNNCQ